jgi:hypothetical protein
MGQSSESGDRVTDRRFVSSTDMKTILEEVLTPRHAVNAKIHRVQFLFSFLEEMERP